MLRQQARGRLEHLKHSLMSHSCERLDENSASSADSKDYVSKDIEGNVDPI